MMMMGGGPQRLAEMIVGGSSKEKQFADDNAKTYSERAKGDDEKVDEGEIAAAHALLSAIERKDPKGIALAFRDAFQIVDSDSDAGEESEDQGD